MYSYINKTNVIKTDMIKLYKEDNTKPKNTITQKYLPVKITFTVLTILCVLWLGDFLM